MAFGFRSDGQFDPQSLAFVVAGLIDRGVHHVVNGVHQTRHVLCGEKCPTFNILKKKKEDYLNLLLK